MLGDDIFLCGGRRKLKRLNLALAFILLGILAWLLRVSSWIGFSPVKGKYTPGVDFVGFYTITHGRMPTLLEATTYTSNLANGMIYIGEYARALLNVPLLLVTGNGTLRDGLVFYATVPWPGVLVLPITILLGVHAIVLAARARGLAVNNKQIYLLTYGLAVLGFPSLILFTTSSAIMDYFGWIFVGLLFYILVRQRTMKSARLRFTAMAVIFLFDLQIYHHTTSLFAALMIAGVFLFQYYARPRIRIIGPSFFVLYGVLLMSFILYLTLALGGYRLALAESLGTLANGILGVGHDNPLAGIQTSNEYAADRILVRLVDVSLIVTVLLAITLRVLSRKSTDPTAVTVAGLTIGMTAAAIFVIGWGGFGNFFVRISAISAVVSILGLGWLLIHSSERGRTSLLALSLAVIFVSPVAFAESHASSQLDLYESESTAMAWVGTRVPHTSTVFSDSRLASPLIYYGIRTPIGFEDEGLAAQNPLVLSNIYYSFFRPTGSDSPPHAICLIDKLYNTSVQYAVYSQYFASDNTGVVGYANTYEPASE